MTASACEPDHRAMLRLVQLSHEQEGRRVAVVDEPRLRPLPRWRTVYELAQEAISAGHEITKIVRPLALGPSLDYDAVYEGRSPWRLLPPMDHPEEPGRCLVTGTGLTHKASAENRQSMHVGCTEPMSPVTDSMKMYRIGIEGGRPADGQTGAAPEWFYKGCGT